MEEGITEQISSNENLITFVQKGPRFVDVIRNPQDRINPIRSIFYDKQISKKIERAFNEKEGLEDLLVFVDKTIDTAATNGDKQMEEEARLFKENLVFVGERELKEATIGIAKHLIEVAEKGKNIFIYWSNFKSERYISLRILEEIDYLTEELPEIRSKFKISNGSQRIAKECKDLLGNCLVAVPDDFIVSGTKIGGFATGMYDSLVKAGYSPDKASEMIEADVIATTTHFEDFTIMIGQERERGLKIFSFYKAEEYRNSKGEWAVSSGASFTGSHCSTDYCFENELERFSEYLESKNIKLNTPLLTNIIRPYTINMQTRKYEDSELQAKWENVQRKYGII